MNIVKTDKLMRSSKILLMVLSLVLSSCVQEKMLEYARGGGVEKTSPMPEESAGKQASVPAGSEAGSLRERITGKAHVFSARDEIYFRSSIYHPVTDESGNVRINVPSASSGDYILFLFPEGSRFWFASPEEAPLDGLIIPYSQIYDSTAVLFSRYPMMAKKAYSAEGALEFKELIGAVSVQVSGTGSLASVHLQNNSTERSVKSNLAGYASYTADGNYVLSEGVDFLNLNCTRAGKGVDISNAGKTFYLLIAPGDYPDGLTLTLTDMDHKGQCFRVKPFSVAAGEIVPLEEEGGSAVFNYSPDEDLLFFEHFDNFVWGGNVKGNPAVSSYAPDASSDPESNPTARKGYEQAFTRVGTVTPGSAFIQTNWEAVTGWNVGDKHNVSTEYVASRNIADIVYMYRCQEFQGCISVGGGDNLRGGFTPVKTWPVEMERPYYSLKAEFDVCLRFGTKDRFATQLSESGIASRLVIDGQEIPLEHHLGGNNTYTHSFQNLCSMSSDVIPGPKSAKYEEGWHHVEVTFSHMNEFSLLGFWGYDTAPVITHGAFIDNVEIRRVRDVFQAEKPLRVMLYNIQYGMWADQANNFNNFAAFIQKYDPDVCIFCEAKSYWKDNEAVKVSSGSYRLFKSNSYYKESGNNMNAQWRDLAKKWGHNYHATTFNGSDLFPQVITSKYPIKTVKLYSEDTKLPVPGESQVNMTRGGGHFQITVDGETINFVTVHLWPFKYRVNTEASKNAREGYGVMRRELKAILNATVTRTDCGDNWLIMGDMNSISPLDADYLSEVQYNEYLNYGYIWEKVHTQVLQSPNRTAESHLQGDLNFGRELFDMMREGEGSLYTGPGRMITSTGGNVRYDMMYGSESMRRRVDENSISVRDDFSRIRSTAQYDPENEEKAAKKPSDHLPVLIEFDMSK